MPMNMMIDMAENTRDGIARELHAWHTTGLRIAIWGSAAESAAFLETHGLDAGRFLVMDSDPARAGTLVPGTSQTIRCPWGQPISFAKSTQPESLTKASSSRTRASSSIITQPR
jgi:hypothetical protein